MCQKLGLIDSEKKFEKWSDINEKLVNDLLAIMERSGADFTRTFRLLSSIDTSDEISCADRTVILKIVDTFAPKDLLLTSIKSKFADNPQVMHILKT